jgi:hypothetical protein
MGGALTRSIGRTTAGAPAISNIFLRTGDHLIGIMLGFVDCVASGNPIDATAGDSGDGTAVTIPGLTTTVNNTLVVDLVASGNDSSSSSGHSGWANASLASPSITEILDQFSTTGGGGGFGAANGGKATAGAVDATTATKSATQAQGRIKLALAPAASTIPSLRALGALAATNSLGASITLAEPTGTAAGDILLAICETDDGDAVAAPSGWTELSSSPQHSATGGSTRLTAFWRRK